MKKIPFILAAAVIGMCALISTSCKNGPVTLEPGGVYTEVSLATADQAILDGSHAIQGFLSWYAANEVFLAKYPEVGTLASNVAAHEKEWVRNAYVARDAYADNLKTYRKAIADGNAAAAPPSNATLDAAIAVLNNVAKQYLAYKTAHPNV